MGAIASQITSLTIVYSIVYSGADQSKHQSFASLAFVRGIHRGPVQMASTAENVSTWWCHHALSPKQWWLSWLMHIHVCTPLSLNELRHWRSDPMRRKCNTWPIIFIRISFLLKTFSKTGSTTMRTVHKRMRTDVTCDNPHTVLSADLCCRVDGRLQIRQLTQWILNTETDISDDIMSFFKENISIWIQISPKIVPGGFNLSKPASRKSALIQLSAWRQVDATSRAMGPFVSPWSRWWSHLSRWHILHHGVIRWKHFPRNWPFVRGIHRSPVDSPHKVTRGFDVFLDLRLN